MSAIGEFGYMKYNPLVCDGYGLIGPDVPYPINPLDIQNLYKRMFDIYCGMFIEKIGEFHTLLRLFNCDYRRTVIGIECNILGKETDKMNEIFKMPVV